jgi:hypothetical protein
MKIKVYLIWSIKYIVPLFAAVVLLASATPFCMVSESIELGDIFIGDNVDTDISISNFGLSEVEIESIETDCGCFVIEGGSNTIGAWSRKSIPVKLRTDNLDGAFRKNVIFRLKSGQTYVCCIVGNAVSGCHLSSDKLYVSFDTIFPYRVRLGIQLAEGLEFKSVKVVHAGGFDLKIDPVQQVGLGKREFDVVLRSVPVGDLLYEVRFDIVTNTGARFEKFFRVCGRGGSAKHRDLQSVQVRDDIKFLKFPLTADPGRSHLQLVRRAELVPSERVSISFRRGVCELVCSDEDAIRKFLPGSSLLVFEDGSEFAAMSIPFVVVNDFLK